MTKPPRPGSRVQVAPTATLPGLPPPGTIGRCVDDGAQDPMAVKFPHQDIMLVPLDQLVLL